LGNKKRRDMYEKDTLEEIRENYDLIDIRKELYNIEKSFHSEINDINNSLWADEANDLLKVIGIDYIIDFDNVPNDRLNRLRNYYEKYSWTSDDFGNIIERDPLSTYNFSSDDPKKELYQLGYTLGEMNDLGFYYLLLPDINFSRGFWKGKFDNAIKNSDDNMIHELYNEIKLYDSKIVEEELSIVLNSDFSSISFDNSYKRKRRKVL